MAILIRSANIFAMAIQDPTTILIFPAIWHVILRTKSDYDILSLSLSLSLSLQLPPITVFIHRRWRQDPSYCKSNTYLNL